MRPYAITAPHSFDSIRHTTPDSAQDAPLGLNGYIAHNSRRPHVAQDAILRYVFIRLAMRIALFLVQSGSARLCIL
jgi:hypothetical protein